MNDLIAQRTRENIALTIGQLVLDKVEAQTAADAFAAQIAELQKAVADLTPKRDTQD